MATDTTAAGLSAAQVAERIATGKRNDVPRHTSRSAREIVTSNVLTLFNAIIGTLCAVVLIFGEPQDALFGLVIVANTGIGIVQELRAKRTLDRLALVGEEPVRIIRDGVATRLHPDQIVLDDEILLAAGDAIVVDGEVAVSAGLEIDESLLTGEADPVAKAEGDPVLSGSFVAAGSGRFRATKVGRDAYAARLAAEASRFTLASSQLRAGIDRFLRLITWLIIPVAVLLTASQLFTVKAGFADAVSSTVAGIVTMIPEGLVLLTSIAFAVGVVRLGARNCLVQELPAIEVLARVDVLCLDKTGTLTEGGMYLDDVRELRPGLPVRRALAELAALEERPNATLKAISDGIAPGAEVHGAPGPARDSPGGDDPWESAGRRQADAGKEARSAQGAAPGGAGWRAIRVVPFSSARKWSGAAFDGAGAWVIGAPDVLLDPADPVRAEAEKLASGGLRVLIAGQVDRAALDEPDAIGGGTPMEPAALVVLRQRLRTEAAETLRYFAAQGVAIKVMSGDNAASVGAVAAELGIPGADHPVDARTLHGGDRHQVGSPQVTRQAMHRHAPLPREKLDRLVRRGETADGAPADAPPEHDPATMSETDLRETARVLDANSVFGRVSPQQKRTFVAALQAAGHTVAMTGDGVNDVLALKDADLGVAMGSGSGATKAIAKVVLLDDNFASLPHVVAEGRRVLGNIERVAALFLTKTMYAIMLAVAVAVTSLAGLAGLKGLQFPFLPRHLTLISTLTIGVPAFVLALAPNLERARPGFVPRVLRFAIPAGTACGAATFVSYVLARLAPSASLVSDRTTATITLFSVAVWVLLLVARPYSWWRLTLVAAMAASFLAILAIPWTRNFFLLNAASIQDVVTSLAVAGAAAAGLTIGLPAVRRLRRDCAAAAPPNGRPGTDKVERMADPTDVLTQRMQRALAAAFGADEAATDPLIRPSAFADYQANVALPLGKRLRRQPREVAAELAAHLDTADMCDPPEVSGPGFLNFRLRDDWIAAQVQALAADELAGVTRPARPQTVVVDYSGPNVAKELHVGHLRVTVVGDAMCRVLEFLGHKVIREAHLGDWGTPFGMLIEHILDVGEPATHRQLAAGEFTAFYQDARWKFDSDPALADRARLRVVKMQAGDAETLRLWRLLVDESMQYLTAIYSRLDVTLTAADMAPESFYNPMLADVCDELEAAGIAVPSQGALCVFPPGFTGRDGAPLPLILRKSDGGYGYATTDVAAVRHRVKEEHAQRIIYVVGSEQILHLQMVFATARLAGWLTDDIVAEHDMVGMVTDAAGKRLRTRTGEPVKLVTLIDEAVHRAEKIIAERYEDAALRSSIAEAVGIGALKYADLAVARDSSYALDFDRMLALNGNTGPYLQYAVARIRSIFRKAGLDPENAGGAISFTDPAERALGLRLLGFGTAVGQVADTAEPHRLCTYLFDLASVFTTFYEQCPVIGAPSAAVKETRLALSSVTLRTLLTGLGLLGVRVPDRM